MVVNWDGLTFFDSFSLVTQSDYLDHYNKDSYWLIYDSTKHADDTVVRFGNKFCFENWR